MRSASGWRPSRPSPAAAPDGDAVIPASYETGDAALSEGEVAALMAPVMSVPSIALAVSGGRDSLALLAAVDRWRKDEGRPAVVVLTVDHALTPGSDRVAATVAAIAAARGLRSRILRWDGPKPDTGVEAAAREARYRLLIHAAREAAATHLVTAHSLEDQAETLLMRLERGSGLFGLAAMRPTIDLGGLTLFRPFLTVSRAKLAATTAAAGLIAHDDPMNVDRRFHRVRIRELLPRLAEAGLTPASIAAAAARLAVAADAIEVAVDRFIRDHLRVDAFAVVTVSIAPLAEAPAEVRLRLLVRVLQAVGGEDYPPGSEKTEALAAAILGKEPTAKRTLAGVVVERRRDRVRFYREAGRGVLPVLAAPPGFSGLWDTRFSIAVPATAAKNLVVAALGSTRPAGLVRPMSLPAAAMAVLPAVSRDGRIVAVPPLGWASAEGAGIVASERVSAHIAAPRRFPRAAET